MKLTRAQRRVRDPGRELEWSGILVDIQTKENAWLGGIVFVLWRWTGFVTEKWR